jgi:hypothetical protein
MNEKNVADEISIQPIYFIVNLVLSVFFKINLYLCKNLKTYNEI